LGADVIYFNGRNRMEAEIPLFRSSHDALRFAYLFNAQQYAMTPMAKLMGGHGSGKGLVGVDGAAQAGMIRAEVERLPVIERSCIIARYSHDAKEKIPAQIALVEPVIIWIGGVQHRRMIEQLILRFYGKKVNLGSLADYFGVNPSTTTRKWQRVRDRLMDVQYRASILIDDRLTAVGCVEYD